MALKMRSGDGDCCWDMVAIDRSDPRQFKSIIAFGHPTYFFLAPSRLKRPLAARSAVAYAVPMSASFFMTLFLLGHRGGACGLSMRTGNLCCGLSQPSFETGLAESRAIVRKQCSLAEFRPRVTGVRVSDDFAR